MEPHERKVLSRRELDPMKCGTPGCDCPGPLILNSRCHRGRPIEASYDWTTGLLTMRCAKCAAHICSVAVASAVVENVAGVVTDLGATGEFPYGRSAPDDEGELRAAMATDRAHGLIRMDFGKPVAWLALPAVEARRWAAELARRADDLDKAKM